MQLIELNISLRRLNELSPYALPLQGVSNGKFMDMKVSTVDIGTEKSLRAIFSIDGHPARRALDELKMPFNRHRRRISEPA